MKKSVAVENNYPCSGCGACQVICPRGAIQYCLNDEGFYHALVDEEKCIDCGLCQSVCIRFLSDKEVDDTVQINKAQVAGAYTTDSIVHRKTTSGGIAYELGRWGIENGYKLLGVVYDYEKDEAVSVLVDDLDGLTRLSGSKYLQSNSAQVLSVLIEDAQNNPDGKYICFGTPCQIFGLRKLITREKLKNEFFLIDLFCHGVPSYLVWQEYISHQKALLGNLKNISFRYKGNGWHQYTIRIDNRDEVHKLLQEKGIGAMIYYPVPLHLQKLHKDLGYKEGDLPLTEKDTKLVMSLPMFAELTEEEQKTVVETVVKCLNMTKQKV